MYITQNMELPKIQDFLQKKNWNYNLKKKYDSYIGMKAYLCTKWDSHYKLNLKNYGTITEITDLYICVQTGYHKGYIQLPRYIYYTHDEIKYLYLKTNYDICIRKSYHNLKNNSNLDIDELNFIQKQFLENNFRTI